MDSMKKHECPHYRHDTGLCFAEAVKGGNTSRCVNCFANRIRCGHNPNRVGATAALKPTNRQYDIAKKGISRK